jgi:drug/metabolite transporter (DMT)-like permease
LASLGVLSLAFEHGVPWKGDKRAVLYACGTALIITCYTVLDGLGVRRSGSAPGYVAWLFLLDGLPLTMLVAVRRGRDLQQILAREWRKSLFGGTLAILAYGLVIWAMSLGPMAQVSALRETSVIFAVLIGVFVLKERFGPKRILAAVLVVTGLIILNV